MEQRCHEYCEVDETFRQARPTLFRTAAGQASSSSNQRSIPRSRRSDTLTPQVLFAD